MFNDKAWATIFKKAYGMNSQTVNGVLLFNVRKGLEMNIVGDYLELPSSDFFKNASGIIRVDSKPTAWNSKQDVVTYRLATKKSYDKLLMEDVHQKQRNLIYKADKKLVETSLETGEDALRTYYKLYARTMLRIQAIPQSYRLFRQMWYALGQNRMKIFLSRHEGRVVSGIIALIDPKKKRLHIWSNGQSLEARAVAANMGTYSAVLKYACESPAIEEVDFGNTKAGSSLAFFKSRFGAKEIQVWTVSSEPLTDGEIPKWPAKILSLLPIPCVSLVTHLLFRFVR